MRKLALWMVMMLSATGLLADLAVQNIKVQQRWPWNGLVDIDYEVVCDDKTADIYVFFSGTDKDLNQKVKMLTMTGDGANGQPVKAGKHRATWNMTADAPNLHSTAFSLHIELAQGSGLYMVIDLSAGSSAASYPVAYSVVGPDLNDNSCRTTKLWLRFIPPNTSSVNGLNVSYGYYMGVFEVTQKQYQLIMGSNPSYYTGDIRPVEQVSYNSIRGSAEGAAYPTHSRVDASSFMGRLRARTGLNCDLPTETQWEYACRAGTTDNYSNAVGKSQSLVARYSGDGRSGQHLAVGSLVPNAWGCYDMLGNVWEWTRDWYDKSNRTLRGGSWSYNSSYATVSYRYYNSPSNSHYNNGFRLCVLPADK